MTKRNGGPGRKARSRERAATPALPTHNPKKAALYDLVGAAHMGDTAQVAEALQSGVKVDTRDPEHGETLLMLALGFGRNATARLLMRSGADVNARDERGYTPVMFASTEILPELVAAGADLNARDRNGETAFIRAADSADAERLLWLMENGADIHAADDSGETALDHAIRYGFLNIVALLKQAGCRT